jgi:bile acid:Na+ symporter, BASS family
VRALQLNGKVLLQNSSLVFLLSMLLGLTVPGPARYMEPLIIPALLLMMSFSLTEIDLRAKGDLKRALVNFALNYGLLSGLILLLSFRLEDEALRCGFIVMAAVPPAVAVLPFSRLLFGDMLLSLYSEAICYLASLILMPGIIFLFTSKTGVSLGYVIEIALLMILLPVAASRVLRRVKMDPVLPINLGFFVVNYVVIGLNSSVLSGDFGEISGVALIALARTFGIGLAVYFIFLIAGASFPQRISHTLFGSYKNLGLAAAVSLVLFGPQAAVPSAVCILAETSFYIFLAAALKRRQSYIKAGS